MKLSTKALRYSVVGVIAFLVDFGATWLILGIFPLLAANTLGFLAANLVNFLMAHRWVFGHPWTPRLLLTSYVAVLGISVVGVLLNNAAVWVTVELAGMQLLLGKIIAAVFVMAWNFMARLIWVYKTKVVE